MSTDEVIIEVRGLTNRFGAHLVHQNLDLQVFRGEVVGVVGASGAGKSVLMHTIVGLLRPQQGHITVFGVDLTGLKPEQRRRFESRWGVLFQDGALFSSLTVAQNVRVPLTEHLDLSPTLGAEIVNLKIGMVGLAAESGRKYPSELSGGMRKRAGLARALAMDPEILFLDEPTAGLDPIGAAAFDDLIARLRKTLDLTVFMVTHDLDSLHAICDRVVVLADHRVVASGTIEELQRHQHPWIHRYFTGPRARAAFAGKGL